MYRKHPSISIIYIHIKETSSLSITYNNMYSKHPSIRITNKHTQLTPSHKDQTTYEPWHEISNNVVCATKITSDQPAHRRSLIRAFASCLNILWVFSYWWTSFRVSKLKRRLHRLIFVYTCQNTTLLEITCRDSYMYGKHPSIRITYIHVWIIPFHKDHLHIYTLKTLPLGSLKGKYGKHYTIRITYIQTW